MSDTVWSRSARDRAKRVFSAIAQAASIGGFLWVAFPVLASVAGSIAIAFGHLSVGFFAAGALSMLLLLICLMMYPLHPMLRRLFYGFRLKKVEVTIHVDGAGRRRHVRSTVICARIVRTGIRRIPDRYCCPGPSGPSDQGPAHKPRVVAGYAHILGPLYDDVDDCWNYLIDLGGPLSAGVERQVSLRQTLDFTAVSYEPRLQRTILDPTDELVLCMRLPEAYWPVKAWGEESLMPGRTRSLKASVDEAHREIILRVAKPKFGGVYRIRWVGASDIEEDPAPAEAVARIS